MRTKASCWAVSEPIQETCNLFFLLLLIGNVMWEQNTHVKLPDMCSLLWTNIPFRIETSGRISVWVRDWDWEPNALSSLSHHNFAVFYRQLRLLWRKRARLGIWRRKAAKFIRKSSASGVPWNNMITIKAHTIALHGSTHSSLTTKFPLFSFSFHFTYSRCEIEEWAEKTGVAVWEKGSGLNLNWSTKNRQAWEGNGKKRGYRIGFIKKSNKWWGKKRNWKQDK